MGPRLSRFLERLLVVGGLLCLGVVGAATLHSRFGQAYAAWSFDQALTGRPASAAGFLAHVAGTSPDQLLASRVDADTRRDWSAERVRAFEQAQLAAGRKPPIGRLEIPSIDLA